MNIRSYLERDLPELYRICLLTGDSGKDATPLYRDPMLLGHYYAAPYAVLEPDLCFVVVEDDQPLGYILGTRDSATFATQTDQLWFPALREQYPPPAEDDQSLDAAMIRMIRRGYIVNEFVGDYPAHLHIDLLPAAQGQGWGRRLMETFLSRLRDLGVPAVHLGVGASNPSAIAFYQRVGFQALITRPWGLIMGQQI